MSAGDYSIADMAIYPWTRSHANQGIDLVAFPNVSRWYEAIGARPAVQRALKVLADGRKPQLTDKDRANLFGQSQTRTR